MHCRTIIAQALAHAGSRPAGPCARSSAGVRPQARPSKTRGGRVEGGGGQQEQASSRNDTHLQASGAALSAVFACRMHYETMSKRRPAGQGHAGRQSRETLLFASATRSIAFDTCQPNLKTQVPAQTAFTFSLHGAVLTTNTTLRIPLRQHRICSSDISWYIHVQIADAAAQTKQHRLRSDSTRGCSKAIRPRLWAVLQRRRT